MKTPIPAAIVASAQFLNAYEVRSMNKTLGGFSKATWSVDGSTVYVRTDEDIDVKGQMEVKLSEMPKVEFGNTDRSGHLSVSVEKLPEVMVGQENQWSVRADVPNLPPVTIQR